MTDKLKKQIEKARPRLKVVSPLAYWIVLVMGWFNIILGLTFIIGIDSTRFTAPLLIVNELLTFDLWGVVFILIGLLKLYSLKVNNWKLSRSTLFLGVSVKAAWMIALTIRSFISPGTLLLNILWVTVALLQMGAYVWFMPPSTESYKQRRKDRE